MAVYLNSYDRPDNQDPRKCTYEVDIREDGVKGFGLASASVTSSFSNINSISATAYMQTEFLTVPVSIPEGNYTATELAAQLTSDLVAFPGGALTVSYDTDLNRFSISGAPNFGFVKNPLFPTYKDWADMIGAFKDKPLSTSMDCGIPDLQYTNSLFFISRALNRRKKRTDSASNRQVNDVLGRVYLYPNASRTDTIIGPINATYEYSNIKAISFDPRDPVARIDIAVLDEMGNELPDDLANEFFYELEIRFVG